LSCRFVYHNCFVPGGRQSQSNAGNKFAAYQLARSPEKNFHLHYLHGRSSDWCWSATFILQ